MLISLTLMYKEEAQDVILAHFFWKTAAELCVFGKTVCVGGPSIAEDSLFSLPRTLLQMKK